MRLSTAIEAAGGLAGYHLVRRRAPLIVSFLVTYRCNQHCRYCDSDAQAGPEMTTAQATSVLEQMRRLGAFKVGLTGGECLVREDIDELLRCAHELGMTTSVSTNGRAVPDHIDAIRRYVDMLQVSVDGPPEVHDAMRGEGSHAAAMTAIDLARRAGVRLVTNTTLTDSTVGVLPYILDLARRGGFSVLFQPVFAYTLSSPGPAIDGIRPSTDAVRRAVALLAREKRRGGPVGNSFPFLRYVARSWPRGGLRGCAAGKLFCAVSPAGEVMPCCFLASVRRWPSAVEIGGARAFRDGAGDREVRDCAGCYCNAYIESSLIFSLNPGACLNAFALFS